MWPLLLVGAAMADLATTALGISKFGIAGEVNPIAAWTYMQTGFVGLIVLKAVVVAAIVGVSRILDRQWPMKVGACMWVAVAALNLMVVA